MLAPSVLIHVAAAQVDKSQSDSVDRSGASLVAVGDMLISFGGGPDREDSLLGRSSVLVGHLGGAWVKQHTGSLSIESQNNGSKGHIA